MDIGGAARQYQKRPQALGCDRRAALLSSLTVTRIGIIGLGYVGLPLAVAFAEAGDDVLGVDLDPRKAAAISEGRSYIEDVSSEALAAITASGHFRDGARIGTDVFLAFSPERVDPGNERYGIRNTPKIVGGMTPSAPAARRSCTPGSATRSRWSRRPRARR
jgi:UDP-N-acetyl-D-mannosaminuronate dehydrogenase